MPTLDDPKPVAIVMTTHNSAAVLARCLESVAALDYAPLSIIIVDNASTDATPGILRQFEQNTRFQIIYNHDNRGFAAAQNQGIRAALAAPAGRPAWVVSLNPDVLASADFLTKLLPTSKLEGSIGTLAPKLLRWIPGAQPERSQILDSTGIFFTRNLRHFDRGSEEPDVGQYDRAEFVFGATGAAAAYRQEMIADVSLNGEFFDEEFFAFREDADLSWRAQLLGWKCLYVPTAVAWHVRRVTPQRFRQLPLIVNWHSVKNRFLMRAKNISASLYGRFALPISVRDALIAGYCVLRDRRLFSALTYVWRHRQAIAAKRRQVQSRRRVPDSELARWFADRPASFPAEEQ